MVFLDSRKRKVYRKLRIIRYLRHTKRSGQFQGRLRLISTGQFIKGMFKSRMFVFSFFYLTTERRLVGFPLTATGFPAFPVLAGTPAAIAITFSFGGKCIHQDINMPARITIKPAHIHSRHRSEQDEQDEKIHYSGNSASHILQKYLLI